MVHFLRLVVMLREGRRSRVSPAAGRPASPRPVAGKTSSKTEKSPLLQPLLWAPNIQSLPLSPQGCRAHTSSSEAVGLSPACPVPRARGSQGGTTTLRSALPPFTCMPRQMVLSRIRKNMRYSK